MKAGRDLRIVAALAALYLIWGTTYYVIRLVVQEVPPLSAAAVRFLLPGAALYAWTRWQDRTTGHAPPPRSAWTRALVVGGLMLAIGNGTVSVAETRMPSSVAALLVAMVPMWTVVLDWSFGGARPRWLVGAGLALGLAGVAVLAGRDTGGWTCAPGTECTQAFHPLYVALIMAGSAAWALGSLRSRRGDAPRSFWQDLAMQMLAGGALLLAAGGLAGEWPHLLPGLASWKVWVSILYLSVLGSVVALACFLWLLRNTTPAVATTYAFVNPAVAVLLAAWLGDQELNLIVGAAAALIVTGVALIVAGRAPKPQAAKGTSSDEVPAKVTE
jgi:drug/metabolite transporter (DMT)-like permease